MKTLHIIISFCIGLLLGHLLFNHTKEPGGISQNDIGNILQKTNRLDSAYQVEQNILIERNRQLTLQLKTSDAQLHNSEYKLRQQRLRLLAFTSQGKDSGLVICLERDSLVNEINQLNTITDTVVHFYKRKVELTDSLVAVRDSQVVGCNRAYLQLKGLIGEQALRENKLREDLNTILKQQKRKRLQNKFMAAGMLFVSGIATSLIVKSRQ